MSFCSTRYLLFLSLLTLQCNSRKEETPPATGYDGRYTGIRTFYRVEQGHSTEIAATDVELIISRISDDHFDIRGIAAAGPAVTATFQRSPAFTYDRGTGLSDCGLILMTGEGHFRNDSLFITDRSRCTASSDISSLSLKFDIKAVRRTP